MIYITKTVFSEFVKRSAGMMKKLLNSNELQEIYLAYLKHLEDLTLKVALMDLTVQH
jgi:hypothetical protein